MWYKLAADINILIIWIASNQRTSLAMEKKEYVGDRVKQRRKELQMTQATLAKLVGLTQATISALEHHRSTTSFSIAKLATALSCNALWLETGRGKKDLASKPIGFQALESFRLPTDPIEIELLPSKGSCGGGDGKPKIENLVKSMPPILVLPTALRPLRIKPHNVFAVIADGLGMANLLLHGDVALFASTKTELISGNVYAFATEDGTSIRRAHIDRHGSITLAFDSADKARYPDKKYSAEAALKIECLGQFFYRQG